MNKVEFRPVHPLILDVVHFESYVGRYPVQDESTSHQSYLQLKMVSYKVGCIGLMSLPKTFHDVFWLAQT